MTTIHDRTAYMPTPAGATWVDEWEGDSDDHARFFRHAPIEIEDAILTIQASNT